MLCLTNQRMSMPSDLPLMQRPNRKRNPNQPHRHPNHSRIPLRITRRLNLLPYNQRQPRLKHIRHLVHRPRNQRPLLIIVTTNLMRPRKRKATDPAAKTTQHETYPRKWRRNFPDCKSHVGYYLDETGEYDGGPACAAEETV